MSNYRIKLFINPSDIYDKLSANDKEKFKEIEILNTSLCGDGCVEIECLALEESNKGIQYRQSLLGNSNIMIKEC